MKNLKAFHLLQVLNSLEFHPPAWKPPMDVYRTQSGWLLKFELAGVHLEDVRFEVVGSTVRLSGSRRDLICGRCSEHLVMEIAYNNFERSIELPSSLAGARISTQFSEGMLLVEIELP